MSIDKKFIFNVSEIDKNYNFEIYNASTIEILEIIQFYF